MSFSFINEFWTCYLGASNVGAVVISIETQLVTGKISGLESQDLSGLPRTFSFGQRKLSNADFDESGCKIRWNDDKTEFLLIDSMQQVTKIW